jgi:MYXO-CTERM domain-containing protein
MQRIRFCSFNSFSVSAAAGALLMASPAFAHIDLIDPPARAHGTAAAGDTDVDVNTNQKTGPCGQVTNGRTADRITTYAPGATINVLVREETNHDSYIRVALDLDGDDDFAERRPVAPETSFPPETQEEAQAAEDALDNDSDVLAVFRENQNGGDINIQVTLPNETSDNATLQVIQLMYDTGQVYYYQCADLIIADGGDSGSADAGVGGTGGTGGSGGAATAGTGGSGSGSPSGGGSGGSGGTGSSAGGSGGGATAAGAGGGSATAGTGSATPPVDSGDDSDDGGCSISTTASSTGSTSLIALLGLALGVVVRRRR